MQETMPMIEKQPGEANHGSNPDDELIINLSQNIGNPARNALALAGITHLGQLTKVSEQELLKLHGVGPKAIRLLREALVMHGLSFAADQPGTAGKRDTQRGTRS